MFMKCTDEILTKFNYYVSAFQCNLNEFDKHFVHHVPLNIVKISFYNLPFHRFHILCLHLRLLPMSNPSISSQFRQIHT